MSIIFKNLTLETLPKVSMHEPMLIVGETSLRFTRSLVNDMKNPFHVRMMVDREKKIFVVQECKELDANAYNFAKIQGLQKESIYCGANLLHRSVLNLIPEELKVDKQYRISGTYDIVNKAMIFDMSTAIPYKRKS